MAPRTAPQTNGSINVDPDVIRAFLSELGPIIEELGKTEQMYAEVLQKAGTVFSENTATGEPMPGVAPHMNSAGQAFSNVIMGIRTLTSGFTAHANNLRSFTTAVEDTDTTTGTVLNNM